MSGQEPDDRGAWAEIESVLREGITDAFRTGLGVAIATVRQYRALAPQAIDVIIGVLQRQSIQAGKDNDG